MSSAVATTQHQYEGTGLPHGKLAIWWFLVSEVMTFGGLLCVFVLCRIAGGGWHEVSEHVSTEIAALNTLILVTSSLTIVRAHAAVDAGDRKAVVSNLGITILLGFCFLGVKSYEYATEIGHGYTITAAPFWSFYYGITGLHALHVIGGIIANICLYFVAAKSDNWPKIQHRVEYAGLYWHFVDVVWIFVFPLVYLS